jgi:hypothetical protein
MERPKVWTGPVIVGLVIAAIGVLATIYFGLRPTDPQHPVRLDFLFVRVSIPFVPLVLFIVGLIIAALVILKNRKRAEPAHVIQTSNAEITKRDQTIAQLEADVGALHGERKNRRLNNLESENAALKGQLATARLEQQRQQALNADLTSTIDSLQDEKDKALQEKGHVLRKMDGLIDGFVGSDLLGRRGDQFRFDPACEQIVLKWPERIGVQIDAYKNETAFGFVLYVVNDTDDYVSQFSVDVAEANAWSTAFGRFLPNREIPRSRITLDANLRPLSRQLKGQWLIRVQPDNDQLILGSAQQKMDWPNNDPVAEEIWRLTLGVAYQPAPKQTGPGQNMKGLSTKFILIRWDRSDRSLQMAEWTEK